MYTCYKHSPATRFSYISLMFSKARCVLSQCNARLRHAIHVRQFLIHTIPPCMPFLIFLIRIICGPIWGSFPVRDHSRSNLGIVRMCNLHNPHHAGHIENYKQHAADLQLVALFPSRIFSSCSIFLLTNTDWMVVSTFRLRSISCFLTISAVIWGIICLLR